MRTRHRWLACFCLLVLIAGCSPANQPNVPGPVTRPTSMDANQNKIFDSLDQLMGSVAAAPLPVMVLLNSPAGIERLASLGVTVTQQYRILPAVAAQATPAQIRQMAALPEVRHVEHDAEVRINLDGANNGFGTAKARADFGVDGDRDGNPNGFSTGDIVVAVIDTGIDASHVDLAGKVVGWHDWVANRSTPYDDHGHGTHVSGIIAGKGAGNPLYKGVAPGASLVGLKVLDSRGSGSLSNVTAAVDWAVANKETYHIRVISMSLGTSGSSDGTDIVSQAVNRAAEAGIIPVVAAGNSGPTRYTVGSPGAAAGAITVGAMADPNEQGYQLAGFSSRGPTQDNRIKPEIVAPGVTISAPRAGSSNGYVNYSGTSMATPFVSGTIALMLDANPNLTVSGVRQILQQTAQDWGPPGQDVDYGWGRLDGWAAVKRAGNFSGGLPPTLPTHESFNGTLSGVGQTAEHRITVQNTTFPLVTTLLLPLWASGSPDFDMTIYNPDGSELARSSGSNRQEVLARTVTQTGTYRVVVRSYAGAGAYALDISGGLATAIDAPPAISVVDPAEGARVSGRVIVKVRATDDVRVAKVEVAVGSGAPVEITGNFDGSFYTYTWETGSLTPGSYALTARAFDSAGQTTVTTRTVTVERPDNPPPNLSQQITRTGRVSSGARDQDATFSVHESGLVDIAMNWPGSADLDFYVYAPDGTLVGRAYSLNNPERLRVDTARWGTGTYRVRVNLYGGPDTSWSLTISGYKRVEQTGTVSTSNRNATQTYSTRFTGRGRITLLWPGSADLDFYVYDPSGRERARGYTINNPELRDVDFEPIGSWSVRVNLYSGSTTAFTLWWDVPEQVLS
ncbi:MAG TPA: S8 family serine peptidase [Symbiobacteriaceae bacterium]|nr:S8 family serine peptidase [Symbiobacteriaceae bacterium]